ncbi:MAG: DUF4160 domain-containing protein, partial [Acidobacteriaceae bacterium]|nr:DUF4160 domain-containing protein [Acidobacteriaceae bacterium]
AEPASPHHIPHFHAYYQGEVGIYGFEPVELIAGSLPTKQRRLLEAWAELHQAELASDWQKTASWAQACPYRAFEIGNRMKHAIHRVQSFEIAAPYTLVFVSRMAPSKSLTLSQFWRANYTVRCVTWHCSIMSASIPRLTR